MPGIRTIAVDGDRLLLNGQPIYLQGFGRHEDFPTSHYPYSEPMMALADRLGILVIDETPAVGLFFAAEGLERRLDLCRQYIAELIARDKNHPSVILWSVTNGRTRPCPPPNRSSASCTTWRSRWTPPGR